MFLTPIEMRTEADWHIVNDITGGDRELVAQAIRSAIEEVASYLAQRYDTEKIFATKGDARSPLILEKTKEIVMWNVIKRSNNEIIYEIWRERYDFASRYLAKIAKGEVAPVGLPLLTDEKGNPTLKTRFGSNNKFDHGVNG